MSKKSKYIAGCALPDGEHLGLRRVEERNGPELISSTLELFKGEVVLATGSPSIATVILRSGLIAEDEAWMLGHLRAAVRL